MPVMFGCKDVIREILDHSFGSAEVRYPKSGTDEDKLSFVLNRLYEINNICKNWLDSHD